MNFHYFDFFFEGVKIFLARNYWGVSHRNNVEGGGGKREGKRERKRERKRGGWELCPFLGEWEGKGGSLRGGVLLFWDRERKRKMKIKKKQKQ